MNLYSIEGIEKTSGFFFFLFYLSLYGKKMLLMQQKKVSFHELMANSYILKGSWLILCYVCVQDKFNRLLMLLPDIHEMAARGEDHLYQKHCSGGAPTQTLLMEMLHAKRK